MVRQGTSGTGGSRPKGSATGQSGRKSGRPPLRRVYRRSRLFAGVVLLLVIAVAFGGFVAVSNALGGGQSAGAQPSGAGTSPAASPAGSASGSPTASGEASASPTATSGEGCEQNLITVTAATDKQAYAAGEKPLLSLTVTNNNKVPWQRNRTVQGCEPVEATPGAGGAYYVFTARLANKNSPKAVFQLS